MASVAEMRDEMGDRTDASAIDKKTVAIIHDFILSIIENDLTMASKVSYEIFVSSNLSSDYVRPL